MTEIIARLIDRMRRSQLTISSRIDQRQAITIAPPRTHVGNIV
jgi:hypothetical protein